METEALFKVPSWDEYMKEKMPRWTDDKWIAIMLFFSVVPFIAGLAIGSPVMVAVGGSLSSVHEVFSERILTCSDQTSGRIQQKVSQRSRVE